MLEGIWHYAMVLLEAAPYTIGITGAVMVCAMTLALPIALARMKSKPVYIRVPAAIYVEFFRGTPLLLQVYYAFFVLPLVGIRLDPLLAGGLAFSLNYAAYISEVYRGAINSINPGQREAAEAMGLAEWRVMVKVILPQAARNAVAPVGNYFVALFKDTALLSTISVVEILYRAQLTASQTFEYFNIYTAAMILYLVISYPASVGLRALERRFARQIGAPAHA